jgi:hypothetical protein
VVCGKAQGPAAAQVTGAASGRPARRRWPATCSTAVAQHTTVDANNTVILALTSQITQLKKQHRQEVQALRTALEQAHGENPTLLKDPRKEVASAE